MFPLFSGYVIEWLNRSAHLCLCLNKTPHSLLFLQDSFQIATTHLFERDAEDTFGLIENCALQKLGESAKRSLADIDSSVLTCRFFFSYMDSSGVVVPIQSSRALELALDDCQEDNLNILVNLPLGSTTNDSGNNEDKCCQNNDMQEVRPSLNQEIHQLTAMIGQQKKMLQQEVEAWGEATRSSCAGVVAVIMFVLGVLGLFHCQRLLKEHENRLENLNTMLAKQIKNNHAQATILEEQRSRIRKLEAMTATLEKAKLASSVREADAQALQAEMEKKILAQDGEVIALMHNVGVLKTCTEALETNLKQLESNHEIQKRHHVLVGKALIGQRLSILSSNGKVWCPGVIVKHDGRSNKHTVSFESGCSIKEREYVLSLIPAEKIQWHAFEEKNKATTTRRSGDSRNDPQDLLGRRLRIGGLKGTLTEYDPTSGKHTVRYDVGFTEKVSLSKRTGGIHWLPSSSSP